MKLQNRRWVGWALTVVLAAGIAGCDSKPKSGNYCPMKPVEGGHGIYSDCIFVNFEKQELKIHHTNQEIVNVGMVANPGDWEIKNIKPETGPWAARTFKIEFDRDTPSRFDLKFTFKDDLTRYELKND